MLSVAEPDGRKHTVWAFALIRCGRKEAGVWDLEVWVKGTVIHPIQLGQEVQSVGDIARKYKDLELHVTAVSEYHPGERYEGHDLSWTEFSFRLTESDLSVDELENEEVFESIGSSALARFELVRSIRDELGDAHY